MKRHIKKFRIHCNNTEKAWFDVYIYKDKENFDKVVGRGEYCYGLCTTFQRYDFDKKGKRFDIKDGLQGNIYLILEMIGGGYISHELLHAALGFFRHSGHSVKTLDSPSDSEMVSKNEELLCSIHECLNVRFWNKYYKYFEQK